MVFAPLRAVWRGAVAAGLPGVLALLGPSALAATPANGAWERSCTLLLDAASGAVLRRDGDADCAQRMSPFSTFKLPLALIGFDAGILSDEHAPRWDYRPEFNGYTYQRHATDPTNWQSESIVWYSQQLTRALGEPRFAAYVARLGYGNRDVRLGGTPGTPGLTHAWLGGSLAISADEQAAFVRQLLADQLPVSARAMALTRAITPTFAAAGGWQVHGKTGSGSLRDAQGQPVRNRPLGWFVGWAERDGRRIVFARMAVGMREQDEGMGPTLRTAFLKELAALVPAPLPAGAPATVPAKPAASATAASAAGSCTGDGWNEPAPPRRIHGNTWYVGSCGISSILVTSPAGHVLLDGGARPGAALVAASVRQLGFKLEDVRYILNSHAHFDHASGIAALQQMSGATVAARGADADALERGGGDRSDPQFHSADRFAPVTKVRRVRDGDVLALGSGPTGIAVTAHATPGHTPGSTSWTWTSCDDAGRCLRMAYADSITAFTDNSYRYGDEASHPGVLAAFRASLSTVATLPCDVLMTPHPGASQLLQRLDGTDTLQLMDASACQRYAAQAGVRLDEFLAKEAEKAVADKVAGKTDRAYGN